LRGAGYRLVVLSNQPVLARGEATERDLEDIHRKLEWLLGLEGAYLDAIYYCPHHPERGFTGERPELKGPCDCRKPGTALLERACAELSIDPAQSWMVGDTTVDLELARRGGMRSVLVRTGLAGRDQKFPSTRANLVVDNLTGAADRILSEIGGVPFGR
jgi:histidinol-phosphate phosphatase family protein